jgi:drug/metabolite transporter (DMT)-like permease
LKEAPFGILFLGLLAVVAYFSVVHFSPHPFNHYLGLTGFIFVLAACSIFLIVSAQKSQQGWPHPWQMHALSAAVYGFLVGSALLAASLAWISA